MNRQNKFDKNRPRLLIIFRKSEVRDELVTLLTACGYYVDYVETSKQGLKEFQLRRHSIVLFDINSLGVNPVEVLSRFRYYKRRPILLAVAEREEEKLVYPLFAQGLYDIVTLPLRTEYVDIVLRRIVYLNRMTARYEFVHTLLMISLQLTPLWILITYSLTRIIVLK